MLADRVRMGTGTEALIPASDLPLGSVVIDPSRTWEHREGENYTGTGVNKPVEWYVIAKNHYTSLRSFDRFGYVEGDHVTLLSKDLIGQYMYYPKKGTNGLYASKPSTRLDYSDWTDSSIRSFLNTEFFSSFSSNLKESVLETRINLYDLRNRSLPDVTDKVFIPSIYELGLEHSNVTNNTHGEFGKEWAGMTTASMRSATLLGENSTYYSMTPRYRYNSYSCGSGTCYFYAYSVFTINQYGNIKSHSEWTPRSELDRSKGLRPVLNIKSDVMVTEKPNSNGFYEIRY